MRKGIILSQQLKGLWTEMYRSGVICVIEVKLV